MAQITRIDILKSRVKMLEASNAKYKQKLDKYKKKMQENDELLEISECHKERYKDMLPDNICYDRCVVCCEKWFESRGPENCIGCGERICEYCLPCKTCVPNK